MPTLAVMSHEEQRDRLARYCPEALDAAFVAGDPCFDRMLASQPLRETYRHRFGIRPDQRCVVISSTWGEASLFGQQPGLALRLARELPLDEYRIVVALHPNVRHGHTPWQVRMWLAECARAGVVVLPPEEGWRAALVAADITVGDHGSVTFYSAALGTPVLLAAWPEHSVDNASPIAALLRTAPRLDSRTALREQLDTTISAHSPRRYADITSLTTSAPGKSATLLRTGIYSHLRLKEPANPADSTAVPLPTVDTSESKSQLIQVTLDDQSASATRLPAAALDTGGEGIVVTSTAEPDRRWLELAEVLIDDDRHQDPRTWIHASLAHLPGCLLAATRDNSGTWVIAGADLPLMRWRGADDLGPLAAALVHEWLCAGKPLIELSSLSRVHLGHRTERIHFEVDQPR